MQFNKNKTPTKPSPKQAHHFDDFKHSQKQNFTPEIAEPTATKHNIPTIQVRVENYRN